MFSIKVDILQRIGTHGSRSSPNFFLSKTEINHKRIKIYMQKEQLTTCFISYNYKWVNKLCGTMSFKFKGYMDIVNVAIKGSWWEWRTNCEAQKLNHSGLSLIIAERNSHGSQHQWNTGKWKYLKGAQLFTLFKE